MRHHPFGVSALCSVAGLALFASVAHAQPMNDDCVNADLVTVDGPSVFGDTTGGTNSLPAGSCGHTFSDESAGVWYTVQGDGTTLTATTCHPGTSVDTVVRVFEGDCLNLSCIGFNDDGSPTGGTDPACDSLGIGINRASTFSWCANSGQTYFIYVNVYDTATIPEGPFELTVSSDGVDCATPGACCFEDSSCVELTSGDCVDAGGVFQGAGTSCGSIVCPDLSGACCFGDGSCVGGLFEADCDDAGGFFQGFGTDCLSVVCPDLSGACCFVDGSCVDALQEADCDDAGGVFQGSGTTCGSVVCADLSPANDDCDNAELVTVDGSSAFGNNEFATDSGLADECDGPYGSGTSVGVWYAVAGDNTILTATTCNPGTDFDTTMRVYSGADCFSLVCVGSNDDQTGGADPACFSTGGTVNRASTVTWCSTTGETYFIYIAGFGAATGNFELTVTSDGVDCSTPGACCFEDGSCVSLTAFDCDTSDGIFQGVGTDCGTVVCPDLSGACCFSDGSCVSALLEDDCNTAGGIFQGSGTDCGTVVCPDLSPTNDDCSAPTVVTDGDLPFTDTVDTEFATNGGPEGSCNSGTIEGLDNSIFYSYTPASNCTASATYGTDGYDGLMFVFTGDCLSPVEIDCIDPTGTITWEAQAGVTYTIAIGDWGTTDGGGITDFALDCAAPSGACCMGTSCSILTEADCTGAGGSYEGDYTTCELTYANSSNPNADIPDNGGAANPVTDSIVVTENNTISSIVVAVDMIHTFTGDLIITVDRDGVESATLVDRAGVPNVSTVGAPATVDGVYTFTDSAVQTLEDATVGLVDGDVVPPGDFLAADANNIVINLNSAFTTTQGTWTITVSDNAGIDTGTLRGWSIGFNGEGAMGPCDSVAQPCPCDRDGNQVQDLNDYFAYLGEFFAQLDVGNPQPGSADFDGSGLVDLNDYFGFLSCLPALAAQTPCP